MKITQILGGIIFIVLMFSAIIYHNNFWVGSFFMYAGLFFLAIIKVIGLKELGQKIAKQWSPVYEIFPDKIERFLYDYMVMVMPKLVLAIVIIIFFAGLSLLIGII